LPNGYTTEEQKLVDETRKILRDNSISVTATVVRVPVVGGHSESVNIEFHENYDMDEVLSLLENTDGLTLMHSNDFQMPMYAEGKDEVFVGRVRRDDSQPNSLNMWIVADNLRKGAATNAVAILERMVKTRNK
jgi:aspartate-semialdehyde dehydrogenase